MKKEVKIGLFAVVMLFGLYWGINFLKGRDLFNNNKTYYAYYDNISGIQVTSPILIKGIQVGAVTKITFIPERNNSVRLQLSVKSEYRIPENSVARIMSTGLIGSKAIELELGDAPMFLSDGDTIQAKSEENLFEIAGSEFDYFKNKISALINNLDIVLGGISKVLEENGQAFNNTVSHVESAAASVDNLIRIKTDSLAVAIDNLTAFSSMLASNSAHMESAIQNLDEFSRTLAGANVGDAIGQFAETARSINELITEINSGEGNLSLLLKDRGLYDSLKEAGSSLDSLLTDIERNPRRYVHFSLFGGGRNNR